MDANIKTILVSPHSDDIAYSLSGSLIESHFEKPAILITIFTKSNFSPCLKLNDCEEITKIRRLEDIEFTKKIGVEYRSLQFSEPSLRGKILKEEIFNSDPYLDSIYKEVYQSLSEFIKSFPNALIIFPMSLGNHIDHKIVSEVCFLICNENRMRYCLYEDLPYASTLTLKEIERRAFELNPHLRPCQINITSTFDQKLEALKIYKSQICNRVWKCVFMHAARLGINNKYTEFIWRNKILKYLFYHYLHIQKRPMYERVWK